MGEQELKNQKGLTRAITSKGPKEAQMTRVASAPGHVIRAGDLRCARLGVSFPCQFSPSTLQPGKVGRGHGSHSPAYKAKGLCDLWDNLMLWSPKEEGLFLLGYSVASAVPYQVILWAALPEGTLSFLNAQPWER